MAFYKRAGSFGLFSKKKEWLRKSEPAHNCIKLTKASKGAIPSAGCAGLGQCGRCSISEFSLDGNRLGDPGQQRGVCLLATDMLNCR